MGLAWVIPGWNSISMFLGALVAWLVFKGSRPTSERYNVAVASGLIAGESLLAVLIAALIAAGVLH